MNAQSGVPPAAAAAVPAPPPVALTPFEVNTSRDEGYAAATTLSGTRLNTAMRDVGASVTDLTATFLNDIAASNFQEVLAYVPGFDQNLGGVATDPVANTQLFGDTVRVRGYQSGSLSQDFFPVRAGGDIYNLERFSFARGPNSLLFGFGDPGGAVNFVSKRAMFRPLSRVSLRFDDRGSHRAETDFNRVLLKERLAVRFAGMYDVAESHMKPGDKRSERAYAAVTFRPFRRTTLRANYEKGHIDEIIVRPWPVTDWFSEWIAAGRPLYDPSAGGPVPASLVDINNGAQYLAVLNPGGAGGQNMPLGFNFNDNYVSRVPPATQLGQNNMRQVSNSDHFPLLTNPFGRGQSGDSDFDSHSFFIEQQIGDGLFVEAAMFRSNYFRLIDNSVRSFGGQLRADGSARLRHANGTFVANPNVGKLFWDEFNSSLFFVHNDDRVYRFTTSYELDLAKHSRWFGKHQVAGLLERRESATSRENFGFVNLSQPNRAANLTNNDNRIVIRTYIEPGGMSSGSVRDMMPQTPFVDASNYTSVPLTGNFTPVWGMGVGGGVPAPINQLNRVDSKQIMIQSRWFGNRIVTTFGWRSDLQRLWAADTLSLAPDATGLRTRIAHLDPIKSDPDGISPIKDGTRTRGIVVNPLQWLGLFYNESENFLPRSGATVDIYGQRSFPNPAGEGRDYGLKLYLMNDRVSLNLGFFESNAVNETNPSLRSGPQGNFGTTWGEIWQFMADASRGGPGEARFNNYPFYGTDWADSRDRNAKGFEATLVANPTPQWRIMVSAAKQENISANFGPRLRQYYTEMSALLRGTYARYVDVPFQRANGVSITVNQNLTTIQNSIRSLDSLQDTEDSRQPLLSGSLVTNYTFARDARFKGLGLGGAARYRGAAVLGYPRFANGVFDSTRPLNGDSVTEFDVWASYQRRLGRTLVWKVQLKVNNLLDEDELRPLERVDEGGGTYTTRYVIPAGRRFQFTSTFEF